jgi:hypothetical protein
VMEIMDEIEVVLNLIIVLMFITLLLLMLA